MKGLYLSSFRNLLPRKSNWIAQLYTPASHLIWREDNKEFYLSFETKLRAVWNGKSKGFGFQLLGFGFGLLYAPYIESKQ